MSPINPVLFACVFAVTSAVRQKYKRNVLCFPAIIFLALVSNVFAGGVFLDIPLPITGKSSHAVAVSLERTVQEIRNTIEHNKEKESEVTPTVIIRFKVDAGQEEFGRGSLFGSCYELAELLAGEKFQGIRTVAYFPQSVRGHALLVALACDERIAAENAEIGEAGIDETEISPTQRQAYHEISKRRRAIPSAMVDKLLDPHTDLLQVETEKGIRLVTPSEVEELRKTETFAAEAVMPSSAVN